MVEYSKRSIFKALNMSIGPKNSSLYKYFLIDKLETPEMLVCAFVLNGDLRSINDNEFRMCYNNRSRGRSGNGYVEIYTEHDFKPNNEFDKVGRDSRIQLLDFGAFNYKKDSPNNCLWLTNLCTPIRHEDIVLTKTYRGNEKEYPKFDNYDAINVNKTKDIPMDYRGAMGVPITFLHKYNPDQFEIIKFRKGNDDKDLSINGKCPYFRILIKNKRL